MKKVRLICLLLALCSCKDKEKWSEGYFIAFLPRTVSYAYIATTSYEPYVYGGKALVDYGYDALTDVQNNAWCISIITSNIDLYEFLRSKNPDYSLPIMLPIGWMYGDSLDTDIPYIEQQIEADYARTRMTMIEMEYRTTPIHNMVISSLEPIFGKQVGESLNDCFDIVRYEPFYIFSSDDHQMLCGQTSKDRPTSIDEWLSLRPLGQPCMFLAPNRELGVSLPAQVRFVLKMEVDNGTVLADTTQVITIAP